MKKHHLRAFSSVCGEKNPASNRAVILFDPEGLKLTWASLSAAIGIDLGQLRMLVVNALQQLLHSGFKGRGPGFKLNSLNLKRQAGMSPARLKLSD